MWLWKVCEIKVLPGSKLISHVQHQLICYLNMTPALAQTMEFRGYKWTKYLQVF